MTKVSSAAIEIKSSRGTFIAIELKIDGQYALKHNLEMHKISDEFEFRPDRTIDF